MCVCDVCMWAMHVGACDVCVRDVCACVCDVRCVCMCMPERVCVHALCVGVGVGVGAWAHSLGAGVRDVRRGRACAWGCALRETGVGLWGYGKKRQKKGGEGRSFDPPLSKIIRFFSSGSGRRSMGNPKSP